jgi:hypothetical protein
MDNIKNNLNEILSTHSDVKYASLMCNIVLSSIRQYESGQLSKEDAKNQITAQSNAAELKNMDNDAVRNLIKNEIQSAISLLSA